MKYQALIDAFAASASPDCSALKRFLKQKFPSGRTKVFSDWTRRHLGYKIGYHDVHDHILPALEERFDDELRAAGAMKPGYQPWPSKEAVEARRFPPNIQTGCLSPLALQYEIGPRKWSGGLDEIRTHVKTDGETAFDAEVYRRFTAGVEVDPKLQAGSPFSDAMCAGTRILKEHNDKVAYEARRAAEYRSGRLGAFRDIDFVVDEYGEIDKAVWDKVNCGRDYAPGLEETLKGPEPKIKYYSGSLLDFAKQLGSSKLWKQQFECLPWQDEPIQKMVDNHIADALTYGIGTGSINLAEKPLTLEDVSDTIKKYYRITHPEIHEFFQESSMNESKPKPTPFFETVTTRLLRGTDISQMSNRDINAEIKSEEIKVKTLEEIEHKTKATMREIAERKQAIADVVTYLDSLEDTEAK